VVNLINELYDVLSLYLNHFQAVRPTLAKERVGSKYIRTYEKIAQTPYQRMMIQVQVPGDVKKILKAEHDQLNPLVLKQKVDKLIAVITRKQRDFGNL